MFRHKQLVLSLGIAAVLSACGDTPVTPIAQVATNTPVQVTATPILPSPTPTIDEIAKRLRTSTVMVRAELPSNAVTDAALSSGTGIVFSRDGYIVTNAHVVQGASSVSIALAGDTHTRSARIIGISTCDDLAVLKVDNTDGLKAATFGKSTNLTSGEEVVALGYPLGGNPGIDFSVTRGIVSRLGTDIGQYQNLIQTDAAINHGNSGGPLVNQAGEIVGINTLSRSDATNMSYAISIDQAQSVIDDLKSGTNRQWLGMNLVPNDYAKFFGGIESGLVVAGTDSGSPAKNAQVQPADLLFKLEGEQITSEADMCKILRSHKDGDQLSMEMVRRTDTAWQGLEGEITIGKTNESSKLQVTWEKPFNPPSPTPDVEKHAFDFSDSSNEWPTGESKAIRAEISNGSYNATLLKPNSFYPLATSAVPAGADMGIVADVLVQSDVRAGVALRYSENDNKMSFYACWVDNNKQYGCFVSVDGEWTTLAEATPSDAIKPGEVNQIGLAAVGDTISLTINGQDVAQFQDNRLARGVAAVYLENFDTQAGASFDNVMIITPKAR